MLSCIVCSICTFKSGVLETGGSMSILWFWSLKILLRFNMEIKSANFLQQLQQQEEIIFWKNSWGFSLLVKSLLVCFLVFFCFIIQTRVNARKCRQTRTRLLCSGFNAFVLFFSVKSRYDHFLTILLVNPRLSSSGTNHFFKKATVKKRETWPLYPRLLMVILENLLMKSYYKTNNAWTFT